MPRTHQIPLSCLMALLPLLGNAAQSCQTQTITATTPISRFSSSNNGWVLDRYTGLMWKKCNEGQVWNATSRTCNFFAGEYTWQQALQQAQKVNIKGGYTKYKDWRVPNIKELRTLVEEQCYQPAINLKVFPATRADAVVWSSSLDANYSGYAWCVDFSVDSDGTYYDKRVSKQVRLVRGGQ